MRREPPGLQLLVTAPRRHAPGPAQTQVELHNPLPASPSPSGVSDANDHEVVFVDAVENALRRHGRVALTSDPRRTALMGKARFRQPQGSIDDVAGLHRRTLSQNGQIAQSAGPPNKPQVLLAAGPVAADRSSPSVRIAWSWGMAT